MYVGHSVSEETRVTSGVPQGSVLGPVLFLIFIDDLTQTILNSNVKLFADDVKLYKVIRDPNENSIQLQNALDAVVKWSNKWQLRLAPNKCQVLHLNSKRNLHIFNYEIDGQILDKVEMIKDLGFYVTNNVKFSTHCSIISGKAMKVAAMIFRVFRTKNVKTLIRAYKVYVRPIVETGTQVWNPYLIQDIEQVEKVQRYYTRRVFSRCNLEPIPYTERLQILDLETLESRRVKADLHFVFKLYRNLVDINFNDFFAIREGITRGHTAKLVKENSRIDTRKFYFANRVINEWNSLAPDLINSQNIAAFKHKLIINASKLRFG